MDGISSQGSSFSKLAMVLKQKFGITHGVRTLLSRLFS